MNDSLVSQKAKNESLMTQFVIIYVDGKLEFKFNFLFSLMAFLLELICSVQTLDFKLRKNASNKHKYSHLSASISDTLRLHLTFTLTNLTQ